MSDQISPTPFLVPLGSHFFTPEALQKAVSEAQSDHPGKSKVLKGSVDNNGANVVLVMGNNDGTWKFNTAFAHDLHTGDNTFGAGGSIAWD